jgi:hypothetical protein
VAHQRPGDLRREPRRTRPDDDSVLVEAELLDLGALPVGEALGKIVRRVVRAEV